ncbi:uncharacterized protein LOC124828710 isoform X2 [Vigna umbellata]|uniref:uncharacterized protein LOC124828710 isoform X2 n=1 Tax=Vigna umbellata TaxID=87088 RepID=UPI001F5F521C|nr:uncharacterized protein LOC124828710 isoform X2 [Vigna umbellata]XP_047158034.1 uncharacterized protein LOC124828710 isoform X2 [Vigna umbellata]
MNVYAGAPLCRQTETSRKSSSDHRNTAFNGPPNQWKTVSDQYSEFSVIDLVCDDEPNATAEKCPTCEDHVSFSLEGLGKVGTETPVHSPEQRARIPYSYSPLQKDGSKSKLKKVNHELDDIELEVVKQKIIFTHTTHLHNPICIFYSYMFLVNH